MAIIVRMVVQVIFIYAGESISLTAQPQSGWEVSDWLEDGSSLGVSSASWFYTMPAHDSGIKVIYSESSAKPAPLSPTIPPDWQWKSNQQECRKVDFAFVKKSCMG